MAMVNKYLQSKTSNYLNRRAIDPNLPKVIYYDERPGKDFLEKIKKRYQSLKADLKVFQACYDHDKTDVQNLKKLASAMIVLSSTPAPDSEGYQLLPWLQGAISKLEEVLIIDGNDHEARFQKGKAHYLILERNLLEDKCCDLYKHHCKQAFECFKDVQYKAPEVYGKSQMLDTIPKYFPAGWHPESSDKVKTFQNPGLRLSYPQLKKKMKEEMIQDAVERLLEAMTIFPNDDNSEIVYKLASQIYFNPWTGNKQVIKYREELRASVEIANGTHDPPSAGELKAGASALLLLWDLPTREIPLKTVKKKGLLDAISMLEEALVIDSNDYEAMFYLGKVHYYLSMDNTNNLGSAVCLEHCHKAIEYFSKVRDEAPTVYKDSAMVEAVENLLARYSSTLEAPEVYGKSQMLETIPKYFHAAWDV